MKRYLALFALLLASACTMQTPTAQINANSANQPTTLSNTNTIYANFNRVVKNSEPIVENACRTMTNGQNCDFMIMVDTRENKSPNALQTLDKTGRPILAFNIALLRDVRNDDELAFVLGHEAAHHILQHISRQRSNAVAGSVIFGALAAQLGGSSQSINTAQDLGLTIGARGFSKEFELEADRLGAQLTQLAGYDAVNGAAYFTRIPDPGNQFLGTHPPNAARIETVRAALGQ